MNLGEQIQIFRKEAKMTIDELALRSGVPKGTINKIIAGTTKSPTFDNVKSLIHTLGHTLDELDELRCTNHLSPQETKIALAYRQASTDDKDAVNAILRKYMKEEKRQGEQAIG